MSVCLSITLFSQTNKKKSMLHIFTKTEQMVLLKKLYSCFNPFSLVPASSSVPLYFIYIDTAVTAIKLRV